jgi:hypothetical protein
MRFSTASVVLLLLALLAVSPGQAKAGLADEQALAERYSPVVRLVEQPVECGPGEPYIPTDVDLLFGNPTVALRGPWNGTDLVKIAPAAPDIAHLYEYHLDFPGNALDPGCDYERWARRLTKDSNPTVYAHVATDPAFPGKLSLQYWFFYPFNDWNNSHEGDWEMIQLVFDANDTQEALSKKPVEIGYSSHEGAERAAWGDDKLELVDGTHPVVYPAAGSHANKFTPALYLGSSGEAGVGCDDTRGPHVDLRPDVKTIPSDPAAAEKAFPWITFEGRWGELQTAFFNGPTGPNMKDQWTAPIEWSQHWRDRSYAVPTGGILGTSATSFFCAAVATGSRGLAQLLSNPGWTVFAIVVLLGVLVFAATRTTWRPVVPLRVARRRSWGQTLRAAGRMYVKYPRVFVGIGVLFIPLSALISLLQAVVFGGFGLLGIDATGESAGALVILVFGLGMTLTLLGLTVVQAATAWTLVEIDEGRPARALSAYRAALKRLRPLFGGLLIAVAVCVALDATGVLLPVAVWVAVRWMLLAQAIQLEGRPAVGGLGRSFRLVGGHWLRVASLVGVGALLTLAAGPLLGTALILVTDAPLALLNVVAGVVYALAMPFVALTASYVYFDLRVRDELAAAVPLEPLPAEIDLTAARPRVTPT